jgi:hypothetical protein
MSKYVTGTKLLLKLNKPFDSQNNTVFAKKYLPQLLQDFLPQLLQDFGVYIYPSSLPQGIKKEIKPMCRSNLAHVYRV